MKIYLLLLNILFASTAFAVENYHKFENKYIIADKNNCNNLYICNKLLEEKNLGCLLGPCASPSVYRYTDCVNQKGDRTEEKLIFGDYVNPFTECKKSSNYHTANIKISDCRNSFRKGNSNISFQTFSTKVESRSFNYFTANDVHDRVLTGYGWCKYNNVSGRCGAINGLNCRSGQCCSKYNYCGTTSDYCKKGCQGYYGHCN